MLTDNEINTIAEYFRENIHIINPLPDAYYYNHVSLCIIDAVWSINVNYQCVINVVQNYATRRNLVKYRNKNLRELALYPETLQQESISDFLEFIEQYSIEQLAENVFNNHQRTSPRNGILKAEAVLRFAKVLSNYNVNYFQDIPNNIRYNNLFTRDIHNIPGQRSGLSLNYFLMLTGDINRIKADRMIRRFLATPIERHIDAINIRCAQNAFERLFIILNDIRIKSLSHLDNIVWNYQKDI